MAEKPLMLKEHLELDSRSESIRWAPLKRAAGTTLRCLLDTELRCSGAGDGGANKQARSHSKSALTRLSTVIKSVNAIQLFTAGCGNPANSLLFRSFSKKLRRGFWKTSSREKEKDSMTMSEEVVETCSLFSPSPVVSSCRSSLDGGDSTCSDFLISTTASSPDQKEMPIGVGESFRKASTDNREPKENGSKAMDCPLEEAKEQLSPVSVMEFPYKDDDYEEEVEQPSTTSPCSQQCLTTIDTTKNLVRRFVSGAELDPVNLDHQFACTETHFESAVHEEYEDEEDRRQRKAFSLLHQVTCCEPFPASEEKLLFEFFLEGLSLAGHCRKWKRGSAGEEELMRVATGWVSGEGWGLEDGNDVVVEEMERSGIWRRYDDDADMVAAELSRGLMTWLMEEFVSELLMAAW
ncbi:hypothetical protein IEQ34_006481 [Dendrobium chrysotoxum]|uniref:DUF4378 domain-containing protein n=1 Tax=Dendrobium chrysotoxum TaxID=161865 RepID=A0AAV7HE93_DENCH|nr:hypothetical protein IEQ34_006481 [Dendrobium chrysotoxum]